MDKIIGIAFFLLISLCPGLFAQDFGIINDPDGYTNVRDEPNSKAKIVGKIANGELFFLYNYSREILEGNGITYDPNWPLINFSGWPEHYFDTEITENLKKQGIPLKKREFEGYIFKGKIKAISQMEALKGHQLGPDFLVFSDGESSFLIKSGPFTEENHKVERKERYGVVKIDGREPLGTDGGLPKNEFKWIKFVEGDKIMDISMSSVQHLYEPRMRTKSTKMFKGEDGTYYLSMTNSDGAGAYVACISFKGGKVKALTAQSVF
ncbi:MAG: hypothetical protein MRZ79_01470 [Bacteroidia bacterium]|nr:hypothetical protein [Bacteroidia bacterium]